MVFSDTFNSISNVVLIQLCVMYKLVNPSQVLVCTISFMTILIDLLIYLLVFNAHTLVVFQLYRDVNKFYKLISLKINIFA